MKKGASWTYDTPSFVVGTYSKDIQRVGNQKQRGCVINQQYAFSHL